MSLIVCAFGAFPAAAEAAEAAESIDYAQARRERRLNATRAASPITLDGALDETAWRDAPVASGFVQNEPFEGTPASEETEVRVVYDDRALYIGVYAHDSSPGAIIVNDLREDFETGRTDLFQVVLDTFHDERNGYMFGVNARGARWDAQMVNEGRDVNANWDGIWYAKTRIVGSGWYAEIEIPFRTLRFSDAPVQTWGINFMRLIRRRNEQVFWSPLPRIFDLARVSLAGTLENLEGIRPGNDLRLKPYALSSGYSTAHGPIQRDFDGGFDAKYGVTTSMTWDFTVNTDFSQVEADDQQINLTRFSLFFPEKRDFFLENSGVYQFGAGSQTGGGGGGGGGGRTNALSDNILFFSRRIGLGPNAEAIPIVAGTRLTGRVGAYTIGAMNIQQRRDVDAKSPSTNFTALRLRRNVLANSDVGLMILNKDTGGPAFNRVAGGDANFRFLGNLNINGMVARTFSPAAAVPASGSDAMGRASFTYRGRTLDTRGGYTYTGTRFNDELGFVPRTGIAKTDGYFGLHLRPRRVSKWMRETFPHYQVASVNRTDGRGFDSRYMDFHLPFTLQDSSFIELGKNTNVEVLYTTFPISASRGIAIAPGRYAYDEYFALWNSDRAARVSFTSRYADGTFYDGRKKSMSAGTTVRVNARLNSTVTWSRNLIELTAGNYTTDLVSVRTNVSFSTRAFLNALVQYNTDARQWSSNIRFNIIHRPLSDIFVVYNDRRDTLNGGLIDRAVIAKMTYLFAF